MKCHIEIILYLFLGRLRRFRFRSLRMMTFFLMIIIVIIISFVWEYMGRGGLGWDGWEVEFVSFGQC